MEVGKTYKVINPCQIDGINFNEGDILKVISKNNMKIEVENMETKEKKFTYGMFLGIVCEEVLSWD